MVVGFVTRIVALAAGHADLHKAEATRAKDEKALKAASDPAAFVRGIQASNASVVQFQKSITALGKRGFTVVKNAVAALPGFGVRHAIRA